MSDAIQHMTGYLVLRASSNLESLPLQSAEHARRFVLPGRYSGVTVLMTPHVEATHEPTRGRSYDLMSTDNAGWKDLSRFCPDSSSDMTLANAVNSKLAESKGAPFAACISQFGQGSYVALLCRDYKLNLYGLYNDTAEVLLWTTVNNYLDLLPRNAWWHRKLESASDNYSAVFSAERVIPRWNRWKQTTLTSAAERFQALEYNIVRNIRKDNGKIN